MKKGFYHYRRKLYYGTYDEDQTAGSGYVRPEDLTPELAEHFSGKDRAVCRFWENHSLFEPEYADFTGDTFQNEPVYGSEHQTGGRFLPCRKGSE